MARMNSPLYFNVRNKLPKMTIYVHGYFADIELIDPSGKVAGTAFGENPGKRYYLSIEVKNPAQGFWKIRSKKNKRNQYRTFSGIIRCGEGLDGYFIVNPDLAVDVEKK